MPGCGMIVFFACVQIWVQHEHAVRSTAAECPAVLNFRIKVPLFRPGEMKPRHAARRQRHESTHRQGTWYMIRSRFVPPAVCSKMSAGKGYVLGTSTYVLGEDVCATWYLIPGSRNVPTLNVIFCVSMRHDDVAVASYVPHHGNCEWSAW